MNKLIVLITIFVLFSGSLSGCKSSPALQPNTEAAPITIDMYEKSLQSNQALHEKTIVSCKLYGRTFEYAYELYQGEEGVYIAKDAETGNEFRSDEFDDTDLFFMRFGRLPPAESAQFLSYETGENTLQAVLQPEDMLDRLLRASSLFAGIEADTDQIALNACTYTAELDQGRLCAYAYTADLSMTAAPIQFEAEITLRVEKLS
ncbi:MAG: hypothetical protein HFE77_01095 [Clostridiales bacterium]|nr:hypothetical protein [Clostridiales bacterium]